MGLPSLSLRRFVTCASSGSAPGRSNNNSMLTYPSYESGSKSSSASWTSGLSKVLANSSAKSGSDSIKSAQSSGSGLSPFFDNRSSLNLSAIASSYLITLALLTSVDFSNSVMR